MKNEFFYLGTLTKPFGLKGDLCAFFDTDNPENYTNLTAVFLDLDGEKLPFNIERIQYRGNRQFVIKFQDIEANEAKDYAQVDLYLPLNELPPLQGNRFYFHEVIGFKVIDANFGEVGICKEFLEVSNNPIMLVNHQETEVLIPASQQFIERVDRENKVLYINAPEGLIDVYLQEK